MLARVFTAGHRFDTAALRGFTLGMQRTCWTSKIEEV
jgi:hypothetical protein